MVVHNRNRRVVGALSVALMASVTAACDSSHESSAAEAHAAPVATSAEFVRRDLPKDATPLSPSAATPTNAASAAPSAASAPAHRPSAPTAEPPTATTRKPQLATPHSGATSRPALGTSGGSRSSGAGSSSPAGATGTGAAAASQPGATTALTDYPFGSSSAWRTKVSTAPVAADSPQMVSYLAGTVSDRYGGIAALNAYRYNVSYAVAPAGTPTVDVAFDDCQGKGYTPQGLTGPGGQFSAVPIPADAVPAAGTDGELSVYSPSTDQLWEFWKAKKTGSTWSACWGGRIDQVAENSGYFLNGFGASASGMAISGGAVRLADVRAGSIDHALSLAIPGPAAWPAFSWPAQRTDGGNHAPGAVPEGTRLRLDPSIDVDSLHLHPLAALIAKAAQRYGFIVTDGSGAVSVSTESGAPEQARTGVDPWAAVLGGTPTYLVMRNFPWNRLQAMPKDYGKP